MEMWECTASGVSFIVRYVGLLVLTLMELESDTSCQGLLWLLLVTVAEIPTTVRTSPHAGSWIKLYSLSDVRYLSILT